MAGTVYALAVNGSAVYAGGDFLSADNLPRQGLAAISEGVASVSPRPEGGGVTMLRQNEPNPFRTHTELRFSLPSAEDVTLEVYDLAGRRVTTLLQKQRLEAGPHQVEFHGQGLACGVYLCRLQAGRAVDTRRMALIH